MSRNNMNYLKGAEKFYDLFGEKDDIEFYLSLAKQYGNTALELGVGTARLAIHLAKAGVETWGIDTSQYMLNAAKAKIEKLDPKTQRLLHLKLGNAITFKLPTKFGLIYFPSCSYDHILDINDQKAVLRNVKDHLSPNGAFVFDLYLVSEIKADKGWFVQRKELDETNYVIRNGFHVTNPETRSISLNIWYELYNNGLMLERYHENSIVYVHDIEGIRNLLRNARFEIIHEYGDYHGKPFKEGDGLIIFVLQPK
jgi:SAM-dependent methyltransferase